jgi:hypothetical protein
MGTLDGRFTWRRALCDTLDSRDTAVTTAPVLSELRLCRR